MAGSMNQMKRLGNWLARADKLKEGGKQRSEHIVSWKRTQGDQIE